MAQVSDVQMVIQSPNQQYQCTERNKTH